MNFIVIQKDEIQQAASFLPEYVMGRLRRKEAFALCAFGDDQEIMGISVFFLENASSDKAELLYLYVREEFRRMGAAAGMLSYAQGLLKKIGVQNLSCNPFGTMEQILGLNGFLSSQLFTPLVLSLHILEYDFQTILDSKKLMGFASQGANALRSLDKEQIACLLSQDSAIPQKLRELMRSYVSPGDSLFYIPKGEMNACILVNCPEGRDADILALYRKPEFKQKTILLMLIAQMAARLQQRASQPSKICFYIYDRRYQELYRNLLGKPVGDYWIQRYVKELM